MGEEAVTVRWPYYAVAIAFLAVGYYVGWVEKDALVVPSFAAALVCVGLAHLGRFKSIKAAGVEATLNDAKTVARESRELGFDHRKNAPVPCQTNGPAWIVFARATGRSNSVWAEYWSNLAPPPRSTMTFTATRRCLRNTTMWRAS